MSGSGGAEEVTPIPIAVGIPRGGLDCFDIHPQTPQGGLKENTVLEMKELDKGMYFRAKPVTLETAKLLRNRMTPSEKILWEKLKGKQMLGLRIRAQHPIEFYIADFYCHTAR